MVSLARFRCEIAGTRPSATDGRDVSRKRGVSWHPCPWFRRYQRPNRSPSPIYPSIAGRSPRPKKSSARRKRSKPRRAGRQTELDTSTKKAPSRETRRRRLPPRRTRPLTRSTPRRAGWNEPAKPLPRPNRTHAQCARPIQPRRIPIPAGLPLSRRSQPWRRVSQRPSERRRRPSGSPHRGPFRAP